jgi:hypothetical protein
MLDILSAHKRAYENRCSQPMSASSGFCRSSHRILAPIGLAFAKTKQAVHTRYTKNILASVYLVEEEHTRNYR